ncbi:MAG: hypothetical protein SFY69_11075 [Planctomycetota bacterium]|nr:hypothetical protein [Planctomycetota bacterium]
MTPRRATPRRAFTLLEVIIVILLLLAMGALILPTLVSAGRESAIRDVREQLAAGVLVARAEARLRGVVTELSVDERRLVVWAHGQGGARPAEDLGEVPDILQFDLPAPDESSLDASEEATDPDAPARAYVLVRFWPDGVGELVEPWALDVAGAYVLRPRLNAWTGALEYDELPAGDGDEAALTDDEETPEPAADEPPAERPARDAPSADAPKAPVEKARKTPAEKAKEGPALQEPGDEPTEEDEDAPGGTR